MEYGYYGVWLLWSVDIMECAYYRVWILWSVDIMEYGYYGVWRQIDTSYGCILHVVSPCD